MDINDIKTLAAERVDNIYQQMGIIENCESILPMLTPESGSEVSVYNNGQAIDLKKALSPEQMMQLLADVHTAIRFNINSSGEKLMELAGMKTAPHSVNTKTETDFEDTDSDTGEPDEEEAEDGMAEGQALEAEETLENDEQPSNQEDAEPEEAMTAEPEEAAKEKSGNPAAGQKKKAARKEAEKTYPEMNAKDIEQMLREGKTYKEIWEHYGFKSASPVKNFLAKQRMIEESMKPGEKDDGKMTVKAVRRDYTAGTASIGQLAAKYGVTKKELYKFIADNHLERPID